MKEQVPGEGYRIYLNVSITASHLTHLLHRHPNINLTGDCRFKG